MNQINTQLRLLFFLLIVLLSFGVFTACDDTETVDKTDFAIYYTGMTDIGPSMTGIISSPSYIGGTPYDFEIVRTTLNDETYSGESFEIDKENGNITISKTAGIPVGHYKLTIKCFSNGKMYEFRDIVEVNMMKPVPDGITVEPNKLKADYADVIDASSEIELPTAQVNTDGNHVSIRKYEIAKSDFSKYFEISSTGLISIVRGDAGLLPGKYILSLKLTTGASAEDEGIFENAVEIDITSRPLALEYTPSSGKIEEESVQSGSTTFESNAPVLKGSPDDLTYSIKSVTPATNKIEINPQTGILSVKEKHGFTAGQKYSVNVTVKNAYSESGVDFNNVFELEVVEYIEPIQNFSYENLEAIQAVAFENSPAAEFKGDEVRFEFIDLPAALQGKISIDHEGKVSGLKGNTIPLGSYTVKIKATNPKSDPELPSIASFSLIVKENPNYFTYVRYGNNLGLTPESNYANQFRIAVGGSHSDVSPVPQTDAKVGLTYEIRSIHQSAGTTIDSNSGKITLAGLAKKQCAIVMVTAIAGKGTPAEYSVQTPVFFHYSDLVSPASNAAENVLIEYTPFVLQVNPNSGGRSTKPTVTGVNNIALFTMDYRRTFNYYNFFGTHQDGQPNAAGSFLQNLWNNYAESTGTNPNYGSRNPLSYYANTGNIDKTLAYVDPNSYELVVNPNKWIYNGEPANGAMIGQITFETNGKDPQSGGQVFPIVLWFGTNF
ncbi:hypothetical protein GGR21_003207 [Dysgonomonas hofstadii]|uniref:DUF4958 domain-containing protein n=1 Tax=Dysgonomonas hofstadii TaxID=637886 RepID=A0A840CMS9_9BACT|nr:surface glycan-binding family protein [Dysgonomonas hofstadii]MBB4037290.1 hypothetical protein [Dysgonomonas hofstadii]